MDRPAQKILVAGPSITQKEVDYVAEAVKTSWYRNAYKYVNEFERKFADYIGVKYAIATSSCTGALHLSLLALGLKEGDEVILPDITWAATAFPIMYLNAKPIFVDVDPYTWCIDPDKIEQKINRKTKAIIPVHLYGHPAEMGKILKLAKKYRLHTVEDSAESIGALYKGKKTGSIGDSACFSFHGTKTLTTGEGGMLVTNSPKFYNRAKFFNDQAKSPSKAFWNLDIGYKYKMSDIQAALGIVQLSRINDLLNKKRKIFNWYKKRLDHIAGITLNPQQEGCESTYWMVTIIIDRKYKIDKLKLMRKLLEHSIDSRPFFYPLSSMRPFKTNAHNRVAYSLSKFGINLPCSLTMIEDEVDYVCKCLIKILDVPNNNP